MKKHLLLAILLPLAGFLLAGCSAITGDAQIDEGVVIAPKYKLRSSPAQVALDLVEVKRGDRLEILEQVQFPKPTRIEEWYKVRTKSSNSVTGWIETRYVVNKSIIEKIEALNQKAKDTPAQGTGRLKVQTRLRLEPGGDVVTYLSRNTPVEIVGNARTTFKPEKQPGDEEAGEITEEPEARTVLWYQVRLPDSEVIRGGWVGAQQVQLEVPDEILHLEGDGRRFTGWVVLDQTRTRKGEEKNNYIGLMKSYSTEGPIDFTRLWVLMYSPDSGRYTGPYIEDGLRGILPITFTTTSSGRKGFTFNELDENGKPVPVEYEVARRGAERIEVKRLSPKIYVKKSRRAAARKRG
ncbi:MAG TPA: SH3 domain-containing protein [Blastocatellia bacterium]|nr:SH3 domain-containing protein [Blastocatellia bacterium]